MKLNNIKDKLVNTLCLNLCEQLSNIALNKICQQFNIKLYDQLYHPLAVDLHWKIKDEIK